MSITTNLFMHDTSIISIKNVKQEKMGRVKPMTHGTS